MNFLKRSPSSASIFCSSEEVPSVTVASAWVSPRVNTAEPCVRGSTCTSALICRMSVDSLVVVENRQAHSSAHEVVARVDDILGAVGKLLAELGHDLVADRVQRGG